MKKIIYVTILSALVFSACEKSKTRGCIDPLAINYESWADYDDGSCLYQSDVVFYEDVAAADYFANEGVDWLDININGDYTGTLQANLGFEFIPDCYPGDTVCSFRNQSPCSVKISINELMHVLSSVFALEL